MKKQMKFYAFWLSAICIVMFLLQVLIPGFTDSLMLNQSAYGQPWRFVSAVFLHGDTLHLIYNLFALLLFGLILEKIIGSRRFIFVFLFTGIAANMIAVTFYPSSLGASGAIFGVIGTLTAIKPFMFVWAFGIPMPLIIAAVLWILGDVLRTFVPGNNIGTIAHLSGIVLGILIGLVLGKRARRVGRRRIEIPEGYARAWEESWMR